jgi:hypothetical protein
MTGTPWEVPEPRKVKEKGIKPPVRSTIHSVKVSQISFAEK